MKSKKVEKVTEEMQEQVAAPGKSTYSVSEEKVMELDRIISTANNADSLGMLDHKAAFESVIAALRGAIVKN